MALPFYSAWKTVSSTPSDYWKDSFQALVDSEFENSPTTRTVLHNGTSVVVRVVGKFNTESLGRKNDNYQKILFSDSDYTVSIGDLFVFDSLNWLCTDISSTTVSKSCTVQLCTNTLSLYKNHILYQIPAIVFDEVRLYSLGVESNKYFVLNDDEIIVTTSNNADALNIELNDRFLIGLRNYKVLSIQDITPNGLLVIKMKVTLEDVDANLYTINILNGSSVNLHVTSTLQLHVNVYLDGDQISPTPTLTYISSDEEICTVSSTGLVTAVALGRCTITVSANGVSDTITVNVVEEEIDNIIYKLFSTSLPDDEIKVGSTKTYVAQKFNNGTVINQAFTFSVVGNVSASDYEIAIINTNTCLIKALRSGVSFTLRAVDDSDSSKMVDKVISLKNLF